MDGGEFFCGGGGLYVGGYDANGAALGSGTIDLAGGVITAPGNATGFHLFTAPIALGLITGYGQPDPGDNSRVKLLYDPTLDKTYMYGVPEPGTISLLALGALGLVRRRRA